MKVYLPLAVSILSLPAYASQEDASANCAAEPNDRKRLACYDEQAAAAAATTRSLESVDSQRVTGNAASESEPNEAKKPPARENDLWSLSKLQSDDPNFFGISWDPKGQKHRGVDRHVEFDISIKYPVLEFERSRLLAVYNGSYDFQALNPKGPYESSPVISTSQNPGASLEWDIGDGHQKLRFGVFHHSNGQTVAESGTIEERLASITEITELEAQFGEAPALERVSRSSWYTKFRYQWMSNPEGRVNSDWSQLQLELRPFYFWNDDKIFWEPGRREPTQLENVDGIRMVAEKMVPLDGILPIRKLFDFLPVSGVGRLELQTGLWSPFDKIGGKASLGMSINSFLISLYYYNGYGKDISAYHRRTEHAGIGLELR